MTSVAELGGRIRKWREYRKLSQRELAWRVGLNASCLCKIEFGQRGFSAELLGPIAEVLRIGVAKLYNTDPPRPGAAKKRARRRKGSR